VSFLGFLGFPGPSDWRSHSWEARMFEILHRAVDELRHLVAEFEPDRFDGAGARTMVQLFAEIERLGAAGKSLATRQVVATDAWKYDGAHRDAAEPLAVAFCNSCAPVGRRPTGRRSVPAFRRVPGR